jgi:hypothetical protein
MVISHFRSLSFSGGMAQRSESQRATSARLPGSGVPTLSSRKRRDAAHAVHVYGFGRAKGMGAGEGQERLAGQSYLDHRNLCCHHLIFCGALVSHGIGFDDV